jgi:hypothetical protein
MHRAHLKPHQRRCGTGIWPDRDISTDSADLDEQVRVSADRAPNPAAHIRATRAVLDWQRLGLCETRTVRWRKPNSNCWYRSRIIKLQGLGCRMAVSLRPARPDFLWRRLDPEPLSYAAGARSSNDAGLASAASISSIERPLVSMPSATNAADASALHCPDQHTAAGLGDLRFRASAEPPLLSDAGLLPLATSGSVLVGGADRHRPAVAAVLRLLCTGAEEPGRALPALGPARSTLAAGGVSAITVAWRRSPNRVGA